MGRKGTELDKLIGESEPEAVKSNLTIAKDESDLDLNTVEPKKIKVNMLLTETEHFWFSTLSKVDKINIQENLKKIAMDYVSTHPRYKKF